MDGGCACGALRYHAEDLGPAWFCHCRACQRASGAPAVAWVRVGGLATRGESASCFDEAHGTRVFCPSCGTTAVRNTHDGFWVALTTLDDPDAFSPGLHIAIEAQRPWHKTWDGLARIEGTEVPEPLPTSWRPARDPSLDRDSVVTLRPVDEANRMALTKLAVAGGQMRFVAPNAMSLLQEMLTDNETWLQAIYAGEVVIGLVLVDFPSEDELGLPLTGRPFLWRFMIDEHYQGLGYGARAQTLVADEMRSRGHDAMYVSAVPGTGSPLPFYERMGFVQTGVSDGGEDVLRLDL